MANVPVVQTWQGQVGIAKETVPGTYVAPTTSDQFIHHKLVKVEDVINDEIDESYQGVPAKTQGFYPGFRYAKVDIDFYVAQLSLGNFLMGFYGKDTKTGAGDPYTHTFAMLTTGGPPSYSISNFDNTLTKTRAVTNAYLTKLSLTYSEGKGMFMGKASYIGKYVDTSQTKPTAVYDTAPHYLPYQNALTLNGSSNAHLLAMQLDFDREIAPLFGAAGTQDLTAVSTGRVTTTGTAVFAPIVGTTTSLEIDLYRGNTQGAFSAVFTNTASHTLTFQMTKCAFKNGTVIDQSTPYAKVMAKLEGVQNTTDTGPATTILLNSLSTAY